METKMRSIQATATISHNRVYGFDLARALAIFGMVLVNFKVAMGAESNGSDWLIILNGLIDGRASALFVVLAGVGISLMTQKARIAKDEVLIRSNQFCLLKRSLFLFVIGLLFSTIWPADILHFYGIYISIGLLFLLSSGRILWGVAFVFVEIFAILIFLLDYETGWDFTTLHYDGFWTIVGQLRNLFFNGFHPVLPWTAFLLVGFWLGRLNLVESQIRKKILWWALGVMVVTETVSLILVRFLSQNSNIVELEEITAIFGTNPMPPMPLYMLAGCSTAIVVICLCVALTTKYAQSAWLKPFISTGQLALTLYIAHIIIGMGILEMFGYLEHQSLIFSTITSIVFCIFGVLSSWFWRKRFKRGPLEFIMRKVTT